MNSPLTLHADFFNAWDPRSLDALMKYCIYAHRFCETVSDDRMPPGMKTTTPGFRPVSVTAPATSTTEAMRSTSNTEAVSRHDHHGAGHHSTSRTSGPAITLKQLDETTVRVHGFGFPAGKRAKVVLSGRSASRSDVTKIDRKGHFTVSLDIPQSWGGRVRAQATTKSGSVHAKRALSLN